MKRVWIVDFLKAIAIIFVIINHLKVTDNTKPVFLLLVNMAVPIFLVLSSWVYCRTSWEDKYSKLKISNSLKRLALPLPIVAVVFLLVEVVCFKQGVQSAMKNFVHANYGPGSYYFYIMVQFVFVIPIIKEVIRRFGEKGLLCCFVVNLVYDLLCRFLHVRVSLYRLLVGRYLYIIAIGVYIYYITVIRKKRIPTYVLVLSMMIGVLYLVLPSVGVEYKIFTYPVWWRTSMITGFYIGPVCYWLLLHCDWKMPNAFGKVTSVIGQASYHIMYAQLLFFNWYDKINKSVSIRSATGYVFSICIISFLCIIGISWWKIEKRMVTVAKR